MPAISDQHRAYADALLLGEKPKSARARFGMRQHCAVEDNHPAVRAYMDGARAHLVAESRITRKDVLDGFKRAVDDAALAGDPANQIAGWREIGKMLGFYEPTKVQVELSAGQSLAMDKLQALSDHDLIQLASSDWTTLAEDDQEAA